MSSTTLNNPESYLELDLLAELTQRMSVNRLAKVGVFRKMEIPHEELYFEIFLHRSVLDRALVDMFSPYRAIREDVMQWLDLDNDDFKDACERALLDSDKVLKTFKAIEKILKMVKV